jgi:hypothetical protein
VHEKRACNGMGSRDAFGRETDGARENGLWARERTAGAVKTRQRALRKRTVDYIAM